MAANASLSPVNPRIIEAQDSVTRPANTTAYAAGDAVSDNATTPTAAGAFELDVANLIGRGVQFLDFTLHKSDHDVTNAAFVLLLFTTLPAFAGWEDNGALAITDAEMLECKAAIPFAAADWQNVITGDIQTVIKRVGVVPLSSSKKVYGILVAQGAYTPASGEVFTLTVHAIQDI